MCAVPSPVTLRYTGPLRHRLWYGSLRRCLFSRLQRQGQTRSGPRLHGDSSPPHPRTAGTRAICPVRGARVTAAASAAGAHLVCRAITDPCTAPARKPHTISANSIAVRRAVSGLCHRTGRRARAKGAAGVGKDRLLSRRLDRPSVAASSQENLSCQHFILATCKCIIVQMRSSAAHLNGVPNHLAHFIDAVLKQKFRSKTNSEELKQLK